jgi:hypothetical protein
MIEAWAEGSEELSKYTILDPEVQKLLHDKTEKFDLVILDLLFNEALLGFGPHFNASTVVISTFGQIKYLNDAMHNPQILSMIPHPFLTYTDQMSFYERMVNVATFAFENYMIRKHQYPKQVRI